MGISILEQSCCSQTCKCSVLYSHFQKALVTTLTAEKIISCNYAAFPITGTSMFSHFFAYILHRKDKNLDNEAIHPCDKLLCTFKRTLKPISCTVHLHIDTSLSRPCSLYVQPDTHICTRRADAQRPFVSLKHSITSDIFCDIGMKSLHQARLYN